MDWSNALGVIIQARTDEANKKVNKLQKSFKSLSSELVAMTTTSANLVRTLVKITDYTDDYTTSLRLLKQTLGSAETEATKFINKFSDMTGIDEATLNKQTAKFAQLGESLTFSNEQAEKFSENLSILSAKLSMLYNTDYTTMANALQKAVQGSQVTLKSKTGIAINDMSLQATLNANAINREVASLSDAEKAIVRYATILRQVTNDTSTYQSAVNSLAWQKQMLSYQFKRLANVTGQLLTPALTQLYIVINGVLMAAIELVKVLAKIFDININLSSEVSEISDSYDDLGASIGGAAKEAKKSLRGFDKLNNLTTPSAGGGGGGALGIDSSILKLLNEVDENFLNIKNKATEIRDRILEWFKTNDVEGIIKNLVAVFGLFSAAVGAVKLLSFIKDLKEMASVLELSAGATTTLSTAASILTGIISALIGAIAGFSLGALIDWITNGDRALADFIKIVTSAVTAIGGIALICTGNVIPRTCFIRCNNRYSWRRFTFNKTTC